MFSIYLSFIKNIKVFLRQNYRGFIGVVCQPSTFSSLELGYVYTPQGQCLPVQEVDLPLWRHGEGGNHPTDFGFKFKAGDIWHDIQVINQRY